MIAKVEKQESQSDKDIIVEHIEKNAVINPLSKEYICGYDRGMAAGKAQAMQMSRTEFLSDIFLNGASDERAFLGVLGLEVVFPGSIERNQQRSAEAVSVK